MVSYLAVGDEASFRTRFQALQDQLESSLGLLLRTIGDIRRLFADLQDPLTGLFAFGISSAPIDPLVVKELQGTLILLLYPDLNFDQR